MVDNNPKNISEKSAAIIIIHTSEAAVLDRCIASVRKNVEMPYESYIINDYGEIKSNVNGFKIISTKKPKGFAYSANLAIEETRESILILLDSNTYVTHDSLTLLIKTLKAHDNFGIAGPSTSLAWGDQNILNRPLKSLVEIENYGKICRDRFADEIVVLDRLYNICHFCYAFKKELVHKIGYFDETYGSGDCAEIDYNTRAAKAGYQCVWVKGAYVHHYKGVSSRHKNRNNFFEKNKRIYQTHFCQLKISNKKASFCNGCQGENCEHFARSPNLYINRSLSNGINSSTQNLNANQHQKQTVIISEKVPLVSCIMPTFNRRLFVCQAIKYFKNQDYPEKELIIVDDGNDSVEDVVRGETNIHYIRLNQKLSIGNKRNLAVEQSHGDIILHWDDDDWYGSGRIRYQFNEMKRMNGQISGLDTGYIFNIVENQFWQCTPQLHSRMFYADIHGGTIMFYKAIWQKYAKFPDISLAEDAAFLRDALRKRVKIVKIYNTGVYIYIRHDSNAWDFICGNFITPNAWKKINPPPFICKNDLDFYHDLISKLPLDSEGYKRRGDIFRYSENYAEALKLYNRAIELDPTNAWAWYDKGQTFEKLFRYNEALQAVLVADQLLHPQDGNRTWIHSELGQLYCKLGEKNKARLQFAKALHANRQNPIAREGLKNMEM